MSINDFEKRINSDPINMKIAFEREKKERQVGLLAFTSPRTKLVRGLGEISQVTSAQP